MLVNNLYDYLADSDNFTLRDSLMVKDQLQRNSQAIPLVVTGTCPNELGPSGEYFWITKDFSVFLSKEWTPELSLELTISDEIIDSGSLEYFLRATGYSNNSWSKEVVRIGNILRFNNLSPGVLKLTTPPIKAKDSDPRGIVLPICSLQVVDNRATAERSVVYNYDNGRESLDK